MPLPYNRNSKGRTSTGIQRPVIMIYPPLPCVIATVRRTHVFELSRSSQCLAAGFGLQNRRG